jgi:hypothetical protein
MLRTKRYRSPCFTAALLLASCAARADVSIEWWWNSISCTVNGVSTPCSFGAEGGASIRARVPVEGSVALQGEIGYRYQDDGLRLPASTVLLPPYWWSAQFPSVLNEAAGLWVSSSTGIWFDFNTTPIEYSGANFNFVRLGDNAAPDSFQGTFRVGDSATLSAARARAFGYGNISDWDVTALASPVWSIAAMPDDDVQASVRYLGVTPVPEPTTSALLLGGLMVCLGFSRNRRFQERVGGESRAALVG